MATMERGVEHVSVSVDSGVMRIGMNRPEKRNALTQQMYGAMAAALRRADDAAEVRVVMICGVEGCFSSGNDVLDFMNNPPAARDAPVHQFMRAIATVKTPVVAAVDGLAIGIGTTMLLHCDYVVAGEGSRLQMPFANLGLCPEAGSSLLLPQLMGHQRASELLLFGAPFSPEKAREYGIVNEVVGKGEAERVARERALQIAAQPPAAVRATKALLKGWRTDAVLAQMEVEGGVFQERQVSPEAAEAFQAFAEKRKPDFSRFS